MLLIKLEDNVDGLYDSLSNILKIPKMKMNRMMEIKMLKVKYNRQRMLLEGNLPLKVMGRESIREC
jgi:hypothetical protein